MSIPAAYLSVILIWSTTPLAIKWSSDGWGYMFAVSARMLCAALACLILLKLLRKKLPWHKQALHTYIAAGAGIYGAMTSVYWGSQYISSGLVAVLFALSPIVTGIMAVFWLNEANFTAGRISAALLGFFGVGIIFYSEIGSTDFAWQGIVAMLLAVVLHSASAIWVKRVAEDMPALTLTTGSLILVAPLYFLTWWIFDGQWPKQFPIRAGLSLAYLVFFGSVLGWSLYFYVLKNIEASRTALITLVTPILALLIGQWLNQELVSSSIWLGTTCILTALMLYQWADKILKKLLGGPGPLNRGSINVDR